MNNLNSIKIVTGTCPYNAGGLAFQDSAPIHQCVFHSGNLHTVDSRDDAFSLVASIEQGCGSCSNIILHQIDSHVEVIWSGCGNVRGPIIDKALQGLETKSMNLTNETSGSHSAHIITVVDATLDDIKNRFETVYSS